MVGVYLANGRSIGSGDTLPARYLPWSILREGNFDLDEFPDLYEGDAALSAPLLDGVPYYLAYRAGHYVSTYGAGAALVALPVYAIPIFTGLPPTAQAAAYLEKLSATPATAASMLLLFWALQALVRTRWALCIALVYAFGTSSLSISSQALWQHTPGQLFVALMLYWLVRGLQEERFLGYTGFAMAAAVAVRSTNLVLVGPAALWIMITRRGQALRFILFALPVLAARAAVELIGWEARAETSVTTVPLSAFFAQTALPEGLAGVLVSPSRGLFVYSPVLIFSVAGMVLAWRRGPVLLRPLMLGVLLTVLTVAKWFGWWGGHSYGPRLLADVAPVLSFFLYPLVEHSDRSRLLKSVFFTLATLAVAAHALGAFFYDEEWDRRAGVERNASQLWSWTDGPLPFYAHQAAHGLGRQATPVTEPTSAGAPELLAASYVLAPLNTEIVVGEPVSVSLQATNRGQATWLAQAPDRRGQVRLGWRWYSADREILPGRQDLSADVRPGQTVRITTRIPSPAAPGHYELRLGLLSEQLSWFADHGTEWLELAVHVQPWDEAGPLWAPVNPTEPAVTMQIAADRPVYRDDDTMHLTIELRNPGRPGIFNGYVALATPRGLIFLDGRRSPQSTAAPWVRTLPLPAAATASRCRSRCWRVEPTAPMSS